MIPANELIGRATHLEEDHCRQQNAATEQTVAEMDLQGRLIRRENVVALHAHVHEHLEVDALPNTDNSG